MEKKELVSKLKNTFSAMDFYDYKDEIIKQLEGKSVKKGVD